MQKPEPENLSLREAAKRLNVSYNRLMRCVQRGEVAAQRVGWQYNVQTEDLEKIRAILNGTADNAEK